MEKNKIKQIEDYLINHEKFKNSYRINSECIKVSQMMKKIYFKIGLELERSPLVFLARKNLKPFFYDYLRKEISWVQDFNSDPKNGSLPLKKLSPKESLEMMRTLKWSSYQMRRCKRQGYILLPKHPFLLL